MLINRFILLSLIIAPFNLLFADTQEKTLLKKVSDINMRSFEWTEDNWNCNSFVEYMTMYRPRRLNPKIRDKRVDAYKLFEEVEKKDVHSKSLSLNDEGTWLDLELFAGKKPGSPFLAQTIDRTVTEYGKIKLMLMLAQPTNDTELLMQRQRIIQHLSHDQVLMQDLNKHLISLQNTENIVTSFWGHDNLKQDLDRNMFSITKVNESKTMLTLGQYHMHASNIANLAFASLTTAALSVYGCLRLVDIIDGKKFDEAKKDYQGAGGPFLSYAWRKFEQKWPNNKGLQATLALVSAAICGLSIKRIVDGTHGQYLFDSLVHEIMHQVSQSIMTLSAIDQLLLQHPMLNPIDTFKPLHDLFASKDKKMQEFLGLMKSNTLQKKPSFFSDKGLVVRAYLLFHDIKNDLALAINAAAELDVYSSFVKLQQEFASKHVQWCFADYVQADNPMIEAVNFWHPMVNADVVVPNSIRLGSDGFVPNLVITGPNAGGKSTILKSLALCILLSQTFGMAPAEKFALTPFTSIATYLNITDDIGSGNSLYKAEVLRVVELMKRIEHLEPGQFSFALFDEVFNGTSPHEGSAAAYSVIDDLAQKENSINLVATHFDLLTKLADRNDRVVNYKVSVNVQNDGRIVYPFKLEPGVSHQHVAIDILRNEGVSSHILDQATMLLRSINW